MERIISLAIWKIFNGLKRYNVINPVTLNLRIVFNLRQKAIRKFFQEIDSRLLITSNIIIHENFSQVGKRTIINYIRRRKYCNDCKNLAYIEEDRKLIFQRRIGKHYSEHLFPASLRSRECPSIELNWRSLPLSVTDISKTRE